MIDREAVLEALAACIDEKGCDGVTIWLDEHNRIQCSLRDKKTQSWTIVFEDEVDAAIARATKQFLNGNRNDTRRVVTIPKKRRREISDLA